MTVKELGTFYIPEGTTRTITFPALREGNDQSEVLLGSDRGTLIAPCYVEEADTEEMLMLKQYNADRLIEKLTLMAEYEGFEPGDVVEIRRTENGRYEAKLKSVKSTDDAM